MEASWRGQLAVSQKQAELVAKQAKGQQENWENEKQKLAAEATFSAITVGECCGGEGAASRACMWAGGRRPRGNIIVCFCFRFLVGADCWLVG